MSIGAPPQPNDGGRYLSTATVTMSDEGRVGEVTPQPEYQESIGSAEDTLRVRITGFAWLNASVDGWDIGSIPSQQTYVELWLQRNSYELIRRADPTRTWQGRQWTRGWWWSVRHGTNIWIPSGSPGHIQPPPPTTPIGGRVPVGGILEPPAPQNANWTVEIEYVGPRSDVIPQYHSVPPMTAQEAEDYYYNGHHRGFHDYRVSIWWNGELQTAWTAHWQFPPLCVQLYNLHYPRCPAMLTCYPYTQLSYLEMPLRSSIGPALGPLMLADTMGGEMTPLGWAGGTRTVRSWEWQTAAELANNWKGGGQLHLARSSTDQYQVSAGAALGNGKLWAPAADTEGAITLWRGWSYQICDLHQRGDVLDMYTNPVTGVPWTAWWANGTIYVAYLDDYASNTWITKASVANVADCIGVGITGDGRIMRVAATDSGGTVQEWHSEDDGGSWSGAVEVAG